MADSGAFRPLWSGRVIDEAMRALTRIHPSVDENRFLSRFRSMNEAFEDALVEGSERLEAAVELPDPDDRHVVAAALRGRADAIITQNTKDFPDSVLRPLGLEALPVDAFLLDQYDLNPRAACRVVSEQAAAMTHPPVGVETLLARWLAVGLRTSRTRWGGGCATTAVPSIARALTAGSRRSATRRSSTAARSRRGR
ncbi:PIN domain-containing protein [Herbiconiux sp. SALV-R1]|uniref:PIN domain-containing protein n=1 Tax=unclassified Herbiconiux TaxID=2618217 RepID=UPI00352D3534